MSRVRIETELKGLQTSLTRINQELRDLESHQAELKQQISEKREKQQAIKDKVALLKKDNEQVGITEHAVLRYLERAKGIDIEEIKAEMVGDQVADVIDELKTCRVDKPDCVLVVKNRTVITVENRKTKKKAKHKAAPKHKTGKPVLEDDYDQIADYHDELP